MNRWEMYGDGGYMTDIWLNKGINIGSIFSIDDDAIKIVDKVSSNFKCINLRTYSKYTLTRGE